MATPLARRDARTLWPLVSLLASLLAFSSSSATSVVIPDDLPTIQQGIDSGADTVYVAGGSYAENLVVTAPLVLLPKDPVVPWRLPFPSVGSLTSTSSTHARSFRFTGLVTLEPPPGSPDAYCRFESCRFDAGMSSPDHNLYLWVLGCTFLGSADVFTLTGIFTNNAFIGSHLSMQYEFDAYASSNVFIRSGEYALRMGGSPGSGSAYSNTISGAVNGIVLDSPGIDVADNDIGHCSGSGILVRGNGSGTLHTNRVHHCDGHGIELTSEGYGSSALWSNVIEDVRGDGIRNSGGSAYFIRGNRIQRVAGRGLFASGVINEVRGNVVLDSRADGIWVGSAGVVDSNIVGRSGGRGIWVAELSPGWPSLIGRNTVYQCSGAGIELGGSQPDSIINNIAHSNGGAGFVYRGVGSSSPVLACNDWFANSGGATSGVRPGVTDLFVNPLFCDLAGDDVTLSAASPLVGTACGQIGAMGVGCSSTTSVLPGGTDPSSIRVFPQPAIGAVRFAGASLAEGGVLRIFDARGALCSEMKLQRGANSVQWDLRGMDGRSVPPGVYFAQLELADRRLHQRVVIAR